MPIAPAGAFNAGILGFCKPISLPEQLLTLLYVILSFVLALVGGTTMDVTGYFGFEKMHCQKQHMSVATLCTSTVYSPQARYSFCF